MGAQRRPEKFNNPLEAALVQNGIEPAADIWKQLADARWGTDDGYVCIQFGGGALIKVCKCEVLQLGELKAQVPKPRVGAPGKLVVCRGAGAALPNAFRHPFLENYHHTMSKDARFPSSCGPSESSMNISLRHALGDASAIMYDAQGHPFATEVMNSRPRVCYRGGSSTPGPGKKYFQKEAGEITRKYGDKTIETCTESWISPGGFTKITEAAKLFAEGKLDLDKLAVTNDLILCDVNSAGRGAFVPAEPKWITQTSFYTEDVGRRPPARDDAVWKFVQAKKQKQYEAAALCAIKNGKSGLAVILMGAGVFGHTAEMLEDDITFLEGLTTSLGLNVALLMPFGGDEPFVRGVKVQKLE